MPDTPPSTPRDASDRASADATVSVDPVAVSAREGEVAPGDVIGRYVIVGQLGAGGMGAVYAAYDPELDRRVAVKVLRAGITSPQGQARLLREAQALARLSHPNAVTIHDVGTLHGRVWLAMELVDGETLSTWTKAAARSWRDVLAVMVPVASGLAAAHAVGLVHRDIKPDNVMIGRDGRARIMDFGLARAARVERPPTTSAPDVAAASPSRLDVALTQTGRNPGTPAYMALEQVAGSAADERSDVFSYCVTLWEALFGQHPFKGSTPVQIAIAVAEGEMRPPPRTSRVPGWLRIVVRRGLEADARRRWPSMNELIAALGRGRTRARVYSGLRFAVVGAVAAGAVLGVRAIDRNRSIAECERMGATIGEVWNDDVRDKLRGAMIGTGLSLAEPTADRVMPWLRAQADAWQVARTEACMRTDVERTWDADTSDRATWCLDERRLEFDALVSELSRGDPRSVQKAVNAAAGLSRIEPCVDEDVLARQGAPPSELREEARAIRVELSRASALARTGAAEQALPATRDALDRAIVLGWAPLVAVGRFRLAGVLDAAGDFPATQEALETAYFEASRAGAMDVAADAAVSLVFVTGSRMARPEDGLMWARHAELLLEGVPDPTEIRQARLLNNLAIVHWAAAHHDEAKALHHRVLEIRERRLPPNHPDLANSLLNLAVVEQTMGNNVEAQRLYERALEIFEAALGPEHPALANALNNLAEIHRRSGTHEDALALNQRALAIRESALGPEHPDVAVSLNNIGLVHVATGALALAETTYARALAIRERTFGREHPDVASSLDNLGDLHLTIGAYARAWAELERSLAIREKALGAEHPRIATTLTVLAFAHEALGRVDRSLAMHERALAIREKALGPDHADVGVSLDNLGRAEGKLGRREAAEMHLRRAIEVKTRAWGTERHIDVAASLANLAEVHRAAGELREARTLHERAHAIRQELLPPNHPDRAWSKISLAEVALAEGRASEARELAEPAVAAFEAWGVAPIVIARARFLLARALWAAEIDRARAVSLATRVQGDLRVAEGALASDRDAVDAWLTQHSLPPP